MSSTHRLVEFTCPRTLPSWLRSFPRRATGTHELDVSFESRWRSEKTRCTRLKPLRHDRPSRFRRISRNTFRFDARTRPRIARLGYSPGGSSMMLELAALDGQEFSWSPCERSSPSSTVSACSRVRFRAIPGNRERVLGTRGEHRHETPSRGGFPCPGETLHPAGGIKKGSSRGETLLTTLTCAGHVGEPGWRGWMNGGWPKVGKTVENRERKSVGEVFEETRRETTERIPSAVRCHVAW